MSISERHSIPRRGSTSHTVSINHRLYRLLLLQVSALMMRPFKHAASDFLVTGSRLHIYQSYRSPPPCLVKKLYKYLCVTCQQAFSIPTMTSRPRLCVKLPRRGDFQQPQTVSSSWLAVSGATLPGTFRLINGLELLCTTPTLEICAFPAPEGHASETVFHSHSHQVSDGDNSETTNVVRVLPRYCALSYAENQPSTPAPTGDSECTESGRWLTLAGPTQSVSINVQVLEDAAQAAYERTQEFWLWVDALCVMPDDEDDMCWHLEHRSQIFSNADCCIVLLAGLGRHASIEERTGFFNSYRTLLDVICPKPEDVVVLHSWPNKYGSGKWDLPEPDMMGDSVHDLKM